MYVYIYIPCMILRGFQMCNFGGIGIQNTVARLGIQLCLFYFHSVVVIVVVVGIRLREVQEGEEVWRCCR